MKTIRLEQQDSYARRFQSMVIATKEQDSQAWVALAESLFYPTSGGQPFDTGQLNGMAVTDVRKEDELVWHALGKMLEPGIDVTGELDWSRRYRHMQRHSAQHLVSQAFLRVNPLFETRSVSLTSSVCTVDVAGDPGEPDLLAAEALVNKVAYQALPIEAFEITDAEVANYPLRRPPKVTGQIRLVKMGDWELSACGGTHVKTTAEALPIKLLRQERTKGLTRVYLMAGLEALADYGEKHEVTSELNQRLSSQTADLPERVGRLQLELARTKKALSQRANSLAQSLAAQLLADAPACYLGSVVSRQLVEEDADIAVPLLAALTEKAGVIALLGYEKAGRANLLFGCSKTIEADMNALLQLALPAIQGRGGGKAERAQGGGAKVDGLREALELAKAQLQ